MTDGIIGKKKYQLINPNMRNLARIEYYHPKSELCFNETGGFFRLAHELQTYGNTPWKVDIPCKESHEPHVPWKRHTCKGCLGHASVGLYNRPCRILYTKLNEVISIS